MKNNTPQLEDGYTRIVNVVLDELVKAPLLASDLAIALFIIRKTWGYGKTSDQISLSQIEKGVRRSRPTIIKSLKNLQLVKVLLLVNTGLPVHQATEWKLNKNTVEWDFSSELVKTGLLVKKNAITGKHVFTKTGKHVFTHKRNKEKQKKGDFFGGENANADTGGSNVKELTPTERIKRIREMRENFNRIGKIPTVSETT